MTVRSSLIRRHDAHDVLYVIGRTRAGDPPTMERTELIQELLGAKRERLDKEALTNPSLVAAVRQAATGPGQKNLRRIANPTPTQKDHHA